MKIKNRQQLLGIVAGAAVALWIADKVLIEPLMGSWTQRVKHIAELRKKVEDGRSLLHREQGLRTRWDQMRTNTLPNNFSLAEQLIHKALENWRQESRITFTSISLQSKHDAEDFNTLECRVEATGDLPTISRFLYDVEKEPMALKLQTVEITSRDTDGRQLALGLQISGLVLTGQESKR